MINSCRTAELVNQNIRSGRHSESNRSASTHNKSSHNTLIVVQSLRKQCSCRSTL